MTKFDINRYRQLLLNIYINISDAVETYLIKEKHNYSIIVETENIPLVFIINKNIIDEDIIRYGIENFQFNTTIKNRDNHYNVITWIYCGPKCRILEMYKNNDYHMFNNIQTSEFIKKYLELRKH